MEEKGMKLEKRWLHKEGVYYAANLADENLALNSVDDAPEVLQEFRRATNELILSQARKEGQHVVKVVTGDQPPSTRVGGYVTFLSLLRGCGLADLENRLGFKAAVLQKYGAYIYQLDVLSIHAGNISPRGSTDWSGGVSPRDLDNLSKDGSGIPVGYHPNYPSAKTPIIQFRVLEAIPVVGVPRFLKGADIV